MSFLRCGDQACMYFSDQALPTIEAHHSEHLSAQKSFLAHLPSFSVKNEVLYPSQQSKAKQSKRSLDEGAGRSLYALQIT